MKRIIAFFLLIALAISAGACSKPSKGGTSSNNSSSNDAAAKVSEFCDSLNDKFRNSSIELPDMPMASTPKCSSEGLIITIYYELATPDGTFDADKLMTEDHENVSVHYSIYEDMKKAAGSDEVRLMIKYVLNDDVPVLSYIIDRTFDPAATMIPVPSFPDD